MLGGGGCIGEAISDSGKQHIVLTRRVSSASVDCVLQLYFLACLFLYIYDTNLFNIHALLRYCQMLSII